MDYKDCYTYTNNDKVCARCTMVECPYNTNPQADRWMYDYED